jgi:hypothetical protein
MERSAGMNIYGAQAAGAVDSLPGGFRPNLATTSPVA